MSDKKIMFYHATQTSMIAVLFELLKKSFQNNKKSLVYVDTHQNAAQISDDLWKFTDDFILPHGLITEEMPDKQPILLTHTLNNLNNADYIFFIGQVDISDITDFERYIVIFDDSSEHIKTHVREHYINLKNAGKTALYYKQQDGAWVSK
jgi:DNA polymerase IIIc chi subunit